MSDEASDGVKAHNIPVDWEMNGIKQNWERGAQWIMGCP